MSKKTKKNADIEAVAEVASSLPTETAETETPTVVTSEEVAAEPEDTDNTEEPEASAEVEIHSDTAASDEHHIRVKSDSGIYDVIVHAATRQDAKYRVYLQLEQFGENAVVPKFDVEKYLARLSSSGAKKGRKKGEGKKTRNIVVVDLDALAPEVTDNTEAVETED